MLRSDGHITRFDQVSIPRSRKMQSNRDINYIIHFSFFYFCFHLSNILCLTLSHSTSITLPCQNGEIKCCIFFLSSYQINVFYTTWDLMLLYKLLSEARSNEFHTARENNRFVLAIEWHSIYLPVANKWWYAFTLNVSRVQNEEGCFLFNTTVHMYGTCSP